MRFQNDFKNLKSTLLYLKNLVLPLILLKLNSKKLNRVFDSQKARFQWCFTLTLMRLILTYFLQQNGIMLIS